MLGRLVASPQRSTAALLALTLALALDRLVATVRTRWQQLVCAPRVLLVALPRPLEAAHHRSLPRRVHLLQPLLELEMRLSVGKTAAIAGAGRASGAEEGQEQHGFADGPTRVTLQQRNRC